MIEIAHSPALAGQLAAQTGAQLLRTALSRSDEANIILATGASQFDMLDRLISEPDIDWHRVRAFHLDEYIGLPITHPASFRKYLWERFVRRLPYPLISFCYLDGETEIEGEINRLNAIITQHPIDVAFIGIGENAHIAFNDPPADFETEAPYMVVELDEACRKQQLGEGWFPSLSAVPRKAISMSVKQIMKSKSIICTVPDKRKAAAVQLALEGPITPDVPASILQQHPDCHFFLDKASSALLGSRI